jgi:hypothetical protein
MKLNNKNLNTFGKYFIMVLVALMVYRMAMPVVEGWKLKDQGYDCKVIKAKDEPELAKILGNNAKRVRVCKDGNYRIINRIKLPGPNSKSMYVPNGPSSCRSMCMNDNKCGGFVYDRKRKMCNFRGTIPASPPTYEKGHVSFIKTK